jgi:quercetin dioxygenase-like cupin family protein
MSEVKALKDSVIFPIGEVFESNNFKGTAHLKMLTGMPCPIGNVTFEPGCRNNWHKHPGGQVLLVTGGKGYYQEWGKPAKELQQGDVLSIPADVKHWHGAAKDSWFVHLAVEADASKGPAEWLEPVSDEEYNKANDIK